ncbi:Uncharacterised protein [Klebsiella pneumoniae]|uniref:Uncharacterized protein n=1 Tax=Klebsiella pneumoniae TaxID=573 RepID=A0A2X3EWG1_KLEPN|nr:Uncharacterised protein [Klebsiella pneumoniae]SYS84263.1 Uncharacterised protein [Klebsiella pneumoniae]VTM78236.1 Uncharacterised protein [Klebsiella pneumoniae]
MAHFTAMMQREKSFGYLVGVHQWVRPVDQQQVEMVRRQITQRLLGAEHDVIAVGNVVANGVLSARPGGDTAFADDFHPATQMRRSLQRFAKGSLTLIIAIDIGVIDGGYA